MPAIKEFIYTLVAPTVGGVSASQTTAGAGAVLINGTLASAGAFVVTDGMPKRIAITSGGDVHLVNFTVTGKLLKDGSTISEVITNVNANTIVSSNYFYSISSITADAAVSSAITVDTSAAAAMPFVVMSLKSPNHTVSVALSGTITATLQQTLVNVLDRTNDNTYTETTGAWMNNDASTPLVNLTSGQTACQYTGEVMALRVIVSTYSSTPTLTFRINEASRD